MMYGVTTGLYAHLKMCKRSEGNGRDSPQVCLGTATSARTDGVYFVISNLARGPSRVAQGGCVLALVYNALKGIL